MPSLKSEIMKTIRNSALALVLIALALFSCKKETKETVTCSLAANPDTITVAMTVVYTATRTGDGTMSSLSYATSSGMVTVNNPVLPWTITVQVPANTKITMTASGTVTNGSLGIDYLGNGDGHTTHASDNCAHYTE
jgi:hypothetical protein